MRISSLIVISLYKSNTLAEKGTRICLWLLFDADDLVFFGSVSGCESDDFAVLFANQRLAQRRFVADFTLCKVRFGFADELHGHNAVFFVVEFAEIFDGDGVADGHFVRAALFDDDSVLNALFEVLDFGSDLAFLLFCSVVFGIFRQVAEFSCVLQFLCNVFTQIYDEIVKSLFKFFKTLLGKINFFDYYIMRKKVI